MRKVISLYSGAGGLDLGLEAAGFDCGVAVEMDPDAVATLRANRDWCVVDRSIHDVSSAELLAMAQLHEGEADLLAGGPPCQPFSKSGYWARGDARRLADPRAATLDAYLRVLRDAKPKAFLLENVPGLAFSDKDEGLMLIRDTVERINREVGTAYTVSAKQLNAVEYGVPQARERVFVVGHREGKPFQFPSPTHAKPPRADMANGEVRQPNLPIPGLLPPATAWDALCGVDEDDDPDLLPRGRWADLLRTIPEGQNYLFHTERGGGSPIFGWRRHFWSMLLKLAKNRPSWTLTAQPGPAIGPFHWKSRRLSANELCALQTFPKGYRIVGGVAAAHKQVGNAVPSAMAEILGLAIRKQLLGDVKADPRRPTLLPARQETVPAPEIPLPVTQDKYLRLIGNHSPHPGTGKGRGALARMTAEHGLSAQGAA
ncbi:MAG: cytosine-specific methyltransferase [Myxococcales bacterium]